MNLDKLIESAELRLTEIEAEMTQPDVLSDRRRMTSLAREHRRLKELLEIHEKISETRSEISDTE